MMVVVVVVVFVAVVRDRDRSGGWRGAAADGPTVVGKRRGTRGCQRKRRRRDFGDPLIRFHDDVVFLLCCYLVYFVFLIGPTVQYCRLLLRRSLLRVVPCNE